MDTPRPPAVAIALPDWVDEVVDWERAYATDEDKMRLAIALSRENVARGAGGPFGAAVFEEATGRVVAVGVNSVVRLNNCTLHAEMMAFQLAQARVGAFSLAGEGMPVHTLATSCDPCAMCLGATLWSGVRRVLCGATRDDAMLLRFDEGPVFASSWAYLKRKGLEIRHGLLRDEAVAVFDLYRALGGAIYNG
ncbi:nucleoside deaminase [Roseisolibacter sp. H3M3-2]|uniref:nucleoside deaminase n=1 Tax=Roseisolibacter sp. H3M3-2 TaxID=3031323 RepID=UPI0023DC74E6|nr:nucleoside deaminase [Roseisolibacter sp. H3M3-2]MDF1502833.1 nucleoside deaminase [Roseisolibacter sp. H3M3-2]